MPTAPIKHKHGFSLIEILLSIFIIIALISVLLTTSASYYQTHRSNLQQLAMSIASKQMETLRNTDFASLPATGSFTDSDLSKLPQATTTRTITNYQSNPKIKLVTLKVNWVESQVTKNIQLETLISETGL